MKRFLSFLAVTAFCLSAIPAFAANIKQAIPFANVSSASAEVETSSVINATGYRTKTLHVSGVTLTSSLASTTFKNMSGTLLAQCGPTSNGPWSTCVQQDSTAISFTTNGVLSWDDTVSYIRLHWTSGTVGGKLKAWLNFLDN